MSWSDINWSAADGTLQVTSFTYDATVVDSTGTPISQNNGWISEVHYPDPATGQPGATPAAAYAYMGASRRIGLQLGNGVGQTFAGGSGYNGLDRFGRVKDLHYQLGTNTIHRYQYGYDASGNRTHARVTQATLNSIAHDNDRSYLYDYDGLQR